MCIRDRLLSEAKSDRNTKHFTKKKSRCQRGGVRGVANQNATTERMNLQTERCSKDEAAALRKNHVGRSVLIEQNGTLRAGKAIRNETRYFEFAGMTSVDGQTLERFKPVKRKALAARFSDSMIGKDDNKRYRVLDVVSKDDEAKTVVLVDPVSKVEHTSEISKLKSVEARYIKKWTPEAAAAAKAKREPVAGDLIHGEKIESVWSGKVVKISDGDTATVFTSDFKEVKIRLNGIDTPESSQAFGTKAKDALGNLIFGKQVTVLDAGKDRYKRTLGFVRVDGVDVNAMMIRQGFAWHYKSFNSSPELAEFEQMAREAKIGLWAGVGCLLYTSPSPRDATLSRMPSSA